MQLHMFTVYDSKAKAYLPPFFMGQIGQAVRAFSDCVDNAEHAFSKHPEDYTLFRCGTFDDVTGLFVISEALEVCAHAVELKGKE